MLVAVPDISTSLSDDGGVVGVEGLHQQPFEQGGYVPKHPLLGLIGDAESGEFSVVCLDSMEPLEQHQRFGLRQVKVYRSVDVLFGVHALRLPKVGRDC